MAKLIRPNGIQWDRFKPYESNKRIEKDRTCKPSRKTSFCMIKLFSHMLNGNSPLLGHYQNDRNLVVTSKHWTQIGFRCVFNALFFSLRKTTWFQPNKRHQKLREGARQPQPKGKPQAKSIQKPWNRFQHENAGRGWSKEKMREEYYKLRDGIAWAWKSKRDFGETAFWQGQNGDKMWHTPWSLQHVAHSGDHSMTDAYCRLYFLPRVKKRCECFETVISHSFSMLSS